MHSVKRRGALIPRTDAASREWAAREALNPLKVSVGNRHVEARIVVGGRPEHVERLGEPESPRVVRRSGEVLEPRPAVRLEPECRLRELKRFPVDLSLE